MVHVGAEVFCFFASAGLVSGFPVVKIILGVALCLLGVLVELVGLLLFTALPLLSCLQLRFQCFSHQSLKFLHCQTCD